MFQPLQERRDDTRGGRLLTGQDLIGWAATEAGRLLADLPRRWAHTQEVAVHAWWAAAGLDPAERELLVAAAYLHDVGYSAELVDTGFHPLDGARHLQRLGHPRLARLVANHTGAAVEACHRGLSGRLARFPPLRGAVADALTYSDVTTGPNGETVDPGPRLDEILQRHGPGSVVARSRAEARIGLNAAVIRTLRRVSSSRPVRRPFGVESVRLGCAGLLRLEGRLETPADLVELDSAVEQLTAREPHVLVCDLLLLERWSADAVEELAAAVAQCGVRAVLLDPPAPAPPSTAVTPAAREVLAAVTTSVEDALTPHCSCG